MTVAELIRILKTMPQDAPVRSLYDGFCSIDFEFVWLSRGGEVIATGSGQTVYNDEDRPADAPLAEVEPYWDTP
jgi:hypothetical protein